MMKRRLRRDGVVPVEHKVIQGDHRKESAIERDILRWLNSEGGCYCVKIPSTGLFDSAAGGYRPKSVFAVNGISDLIAMRDGRALFLEVKRPGAKQSLDQVKFMKAVRSKGMVYEVLTSVDDAEELIERLFGV